MEVGSPPPKQSACRGGQLQLQSAAPSPTLHPPSFTPSHPNSHTSTALHLPLSPPSPPHLPWTLTQQSVGCGGSCYLAVCPYYTYLPPPSTFPSLHPNLPSPPPPPAHTHLRPLPICLDVGFPVSTRGAPAPYPPGSLPAGVSSCLARLIFPRQSAYGGGRSSPTVCWPG